MHARGLPSRPSRSTGAPRAAGAAPADTYFAAWALVLPVSSVLVVPFFQGTTPAYLFAMALLFPPVAALVLGLDDGLRFYRRLAGCVLVFVALTAVSQLSLAASDIRGFSTLSLVDSGDRSVLLRRTMFTQSLYLLAAGSLFVYASLFYKPSWDRFFLAGAIGLALYGMYEVGFFLATGQSGDFLSNRTFGGGYWTGSWFQVINIGPLVVQRLKSLTGEPSMYALTALPFCIYAFHTGRPKTGTVLLASLLMTTSTTALLGIVVYFALRLAFMGPADRLSLAVIAAASAVLLLAAGGNEFVLDVYDKVVVRKLSLQDSSGLSRFRSFEDNTRYFLAAPWNVQLFGLGFGYVRATNMFSNILLNMGGVGLIVTLAVFLVPVIFMPRGYRELGLRAALVVTLLAMMLSVPEFSYLSTWLFLGLAYNRLADRRTDAGCDRAARHGARGNREAGIVAAAAGPEKSS